MANGTAIFVYQRPTAHAKRLGHGILQAALKSTQLNRVNFIVHLKRPVQIALRRSRLICQNKTKLEYKIEGFKRM